MKAGSASILLQGRELLLRVVGLDGVCLVESTERLLCLRFLAKAAPALALLKIWVGACCCASDKVGRGASEGIDKEENRSTARDNAC